MTDLNSYAETLQRLAMATAKQLAADHPHMAKSPSDLLALAWYHQVAVDAEACVSLWSDDNKRIAKAAKLIATAHHGDLINDPTMLPGMQPMIHKMKFTGATIVSVGTSIMGARPLWFQYMSLIHDMEEAGAIKITVKS